MTENTQLGSLVELYVKTDEKLRAVLRPQILSQLNAGEFMVSSRLSIYYYLAEYPELHFILESKSLKFMIDDTTNAASGTLSGITGHHANTPLNRAIYFSNNLFIEKLFPKLQQHIAPEVLLNSVKMAVNYGNTTLLELYHDAEAIKKYRNAYGQNMSYLASDVKTLDYMEAKFGLIPKSREEWVEKKIYSFLKESNRFMPERVSEFAERIAACSDINLEYYTSKKTHKAPALWVFLAQNPEQLSKFASHMSPQATDSQGNNFAYFLFDSFWKTAPNLKDTDTLAFIGDYIKNYDLDAKNADGMSALDKVQRIVDKKTSTESKRLDQFKLYCEKIIFDNSLKAAPSARRHKL